MLGRLLEVPSRRKLQRDPEELYSLITQKRGAFKLFLCANVCAKRNGRLYVARNVLILMVSRAGIEPATR